MVLTLYYSPMSQPSRAVLSFLHLTGISYEKKVIDLIKKEQKDPEYLKINPLGTVPAIKDGEFTLFESEAIIKYLMNTRKVGGEYYPSDPEQRALVDKYLPYHHIHFRPALVKYFLSEYSSVLNSNLTKESTRPGLEEALDKFEKIILGSRKYIAGEMLSIADLFAVNELTMIYYTTDFDLSNYPHVKEYIERCLLNPVIREINQPVKEFPEKIKLMMQAKKEQQ